MKIFYAIIELLVFSYFHMSQLWRVTRMRSRSYYINVLFISLIVLFASIQNAYAYLDPGTGSYIFQVIIAVALGGLFVLKLMWHKLVILIKRIFTGKKN